MKFLTECFIAGFLGTALCLQWSRFEQWKNFTTSLKKSSPLCINSRKQMIKCCMVCGSIPECTSVVLNNDHCICSSGLFPHASQVDNNPSVYVKRPKSCSAPGYFFINTMCIKVSTDQNTWHEAKLDCENSGGTLIILDSLEKHQRVHDMFSQYFDDIADRYFVGASDFGKEGIWKWIKENSSSYIHNSYFNDGDPSFPDQRAHCGTFNFNRNGISDSFCDGPINYICEILF